MAEPTPRLFAFGESLGVSETAFEVVKMDVVLSVPGHAECGSSVQMGQCD
jgi:hypothetical protein